MAQQQKSTNWFAVWVSIGVVVAIVAVGALVVWMNAAASAPAPRPDSAGIDQESGAILVGTGSNEVDVYFDFYCGHCQVFEQTYGETIDDALADESITLRLFPVALPSLNAASGTDFSKRGSNAAYCVAEAEPEAAYPFFQSVFALNPSGAGLSDDELLKLATEAGAPESVADCFSARAWDDLVQENTDNLPENPETGSRGTPTLLVNGEYISVTGNPQADILDRLN
ncbi:DsbA family protein [Microbacterium sp. No. 7]|uniref:DsbA family protein n=1 Tax=Microbacterium sp. No. 7 TaxID=1714373 RepID=UPI0006D2A040|nr:thioredoxin domain-containing protein [Microbacterium sp. No. 7]ALJ19017.1 hypothetical protein AOA12_03470 [Microbacterium sp. No. 7]